MSEETENIDIITLSSDDEDPQPGPSRPDTSVGRTPVVPQSQGSDSSNESDDEFAKLVASADEAAELRIRLAQTQKLLQEKTEELAHLDYTTNRRIQVLQHRNTLFRKRYLNEIRETEIAETKNCWMERVLKATQDKLLMQQQELAGPSNMGKKRKPSSDNSTHTQSRQEPGGVGNKASATREQTAKKSASEQQNRESRMNKRELLKKDWELQTVKQESEQKDWELQTVKQESEQKEWELQKVKRESEQRERELQKVKQESDQRERELQKVKQESEQKEQEPEQKKRKD